jgi:hypothetical protein
MDTILVEHPRLVEAEHQMEALVRHGRRNPGREKQCMALIAPSGCGKSTILQDFVAKLNSPEALQERRIPALYVKLKPTIGKKSMAQDILFALAAISGKDTTPDHGNENILLERVVAYLAQASCEILVIDEFHHVLLSDTEKQRKAVSETIKWLLLSGPCPVVVAGTDKAWEPFQDNPQLARRAVPAVCLDPLSKEKKADREWFGKFFGQYFVRMEELKIANNAKSLVHGNVLNCLMDASDGIVGLGCKILGEAVRQMALAGRQNLSLEDFIHGTDRLLIGTSIKSNPFRGELRGMKVAAE